MAIEVKLCRFFGQKSRSFAACSDGWEHISYRLNRNFQFPCKFVYLLNVVTVILSNRAVEFDFYTCFVKLSYRINYLFVCTAVAAKLVAEGDDSTVAAIGSEAAAEVFGLEVLKSHINEKGGNTTRFAVFCPAVETPSEKDEHFVMVFTVKNEAGALAKAVSAIGECGFNLRAIKSRPTKNLSWEYYFFCEGDGRILSPEGEKMLKLLEENCNDLKVLGSYEKEIVIQ